MLTVRCTAKLLKRLPGDPLADPPPSTTRLGDWYATILVMRPYHLVMLVNETTRLPVFIPARPLATLAARIPDAIARVLFELGIAPGVIAEERRAMAQVVFAKTASRSVVGTMTQFTFELPYMIERDLTISDLALSLELAQTLTTIPPSGYEVPAEQVVRVLGDAK
jgi:hypothetical protein